MPVLSIGFSKYGGWAHTVNTQSSYSLFRLSTRLDGTQTPARWQYSMDGAWTDFQASATVLFA